MSIQFGPDELPMRRSFIYGRQGDDQKKPFRMMYGISLAPPENIDPGEFASSVISDERKAKITRIKLDLGTKDVVLATGSLAEPLAAMQKCSADLVEKMGLDASNIASPAQPLNLVSLARKIPYPRKMLQANDEGRVLFRLTVNRAGVPTTCQIAQSTRPQTFDDVVCFALLRELRFEPAKDAAGKPVHSTYSSAVNFQMD